LLNKCEICLSFEKRGRLRIKNSTFEKNKIMKKILMIAAAVLLMVSCDKDQKAVKKLDGKWNVTKMLVTEDGKSLDLITFGAVVEYSFNSCKLADDEFCDVSVVFTALGETSETSSGKFKVTGDGTVLTIADDVATTESYTTFEIVELKGSNCSLKQTGVDGNIELELEKK
jgi:hypothetical protein